MYDVEKWERCIGRDKKPIPRPANMGTPCESCPRKGPQFEAETTLSEQGWRAYQYYLEVRATNGVILSDREKCDPLGRRILSIVDVIQRNHELNQIVEAGQLSAQIAAMRR
jgi:hypothetical protein